MTVGADAVVDLGHFISHTRRNRTFRNIANRFTRQGYTVTRHVPPHTSAVLRDVLAIAESWQGLPRRQEWAFLTGAPCEDYLKQVDLYILRDSRGFAQAFVNLVPAYQSRTTTVDLMRYRADAPANSMDYLLLRLLETLHQTGCAQFSLGLSPLDGRPEKGDKAGRLLRHLGASGNAIVRCRGLHQFKAKYEPAWKNRYIWYRGSLLGLVQIGLAVQALMTDMPTPSPRERRAVAPPLFSIGHPEVTPDYAER